MMTIQQHQQIVWHHDLSIMKKCNVSWIEKAQIINSSALNGYDWLNRCVSFENPVWYLQPGSWEQSTNAIQPQPICSEIEALHKLTNRLDSISII